MNYNEMSDSELSEEIRVIREDLKDSRKDLKAAEADVSTAKRDIADCESLIFQLEALQRERKIARLTAAGRLPQRQNPVPDAAASGGMILKMPGVALTGPKAERAHIYCPTCRTDFLRPVERPHAPPYAVRHHGDGTHTDPETGEVLVKA